MPDPTAPESSPGTTAPPKAPATAAYAFSTDWFTPSLPAWQPMVEQLQPARYLEIGCWEGRSSCWMIEYMGQRKPFELVTIDPWAMDHGDSVVARYDHNVAIAKSRVPHPIVHHRLRAFSWDALPSLLAQVGRDQFDMVFIDGYHHSEDVFFESALCFQLLRLGGVMVFDDYLWQEEAHVPLAQRDPYKSAKLGVDAFLNCHFRSMEILYQSAGQVFIRKLRTRAPAPERQA